MQLLATSSFALVAVSLSWVQLALCSVTPLNLELAPTGQMVTPTVEQRQLTSNLAVLHTASNLKTACQVVEIVSSNALLVSLVGNVVLSNLKSTSASTTIMNIPASKFFQGAILSAAAVLIVAMIVDIAAGSETQVTVAEVSKPLGLVVLTKEACRRLNDLAIATDEQAEEEHGVARWEQHWTNFESIFESARDVAHSKLVANITSLPVESWPAIPDLPELSETPTASEQSVFNQEFTKWGQENLMTITRIKHELAARYMTMHYDETMAAVWQQNKHPVFVNDSVAFEQLSRTFLDRSSLPNYCSAHVKEAKSVTRKMKGIRKSQETRDEKVNLLLQSHYEAKDELSKKDLP